LYFFFVVFPIDKFPIVVFLLKDWETERARLLYKDDVRSTTTSKLLAACSLLLLLRPGRQGKVSGNRLIVDSFKSGTSSERLLESVNSHEIKSVSQTVSWRSRKEDFALSPYTTVSGFRSDFPTVKWMFGGTCRRFRPQSRAGGSWRGNH